MARYTKHFAIIAFSLLFMLTVVPAAGWAAEDDQDEEDQDEQAVTHGRSFVDNDGDGYNDLAPDHDNDGIPNGQDPDFTRGAGQGQNAGLHYLDRNRDGRCDRAEQGMHRGWGWGKGRQGAGPGNGQQGRGFVDRDGDGYNDNAPDHDNDGIPNGQDADFTRGAGQGQNAGQGPYYIDRDGDGRCDRAENE